MTSDFERVYDTIMAAWSSQVIRALAVFSIAEELETHPRSSNSVAASTGTDPGAMRRLLLAGNALEVIEHQADKDVFASTSTLQVLSASAQPSLRAYAIAAIGPAFWLPAVHLPEAIRTGQGQAMPALGSGVIEWLQQHPQEAAMMGTAMSGLSAPVITEAAAVIDVNDDATICDVGGAEGAFAAELLHRTPSAHAVVLELPETSPAADAYAEAHDLEGRLRGVPGDFFIEVPPADIYLLKFVLHDWDDAAATQILTTIRRGMTVDERLFVVEMTSRPGSPTGLTTMDMAMLFSNGGRERSLDELDQLAASAGLIRRNVALLQTPYACIEYGCR